MKNTTKTAAGKATKNTTAARDAQLAAIAKTLGFDSLETQRIGDKDFREVAVWSLKNALEAAFAAGKASK